MNPPSNKTKNKIDERLDVAVCDDLLQIYLHEQRYQKALELVLPNDDLLEIGTGLGVFSERAAPVSTSYRGIEYDAETCLAAKKRVPNPDWITQGDAQALTFADGSFDAVVCLEVLEHLPDFRKALDEICRVLRPEGRLIASIPYARIGAPSKLNPYHLYEPGEVEFLNELEARFGKVEISFHRYQETAFESFSRVLRIRRLVGLAGQYADMTRGSPKEMKKIVIDGNRSGMLLGIFAVATSPKFL